MHLNDTVIACCDYVCVSYSYSEICEFLKNWLVPVAMSAIHLVTSFTEMPVCAHLRRVVMWNTLVSIKIIAGCSYSYSGNKVCHCLLKQPSSFEEQQLWPERLITDVNSVPYNCNATCAAPATATSTSRVRTSNCATRKIIEHNKCK